MSPVILSGIVAINLALLAYTAGIVAVHRHRRASPFVLRVFALGLALDLVATGCMVAGSHRGWFTPHGIVGYVALAVMVVVVVLLWGLRREGKDAQIPAGLGMFLRGAYGGWLIAYAIGVIMASRR